MPSAPPRRRRSARPSRSREGAPTARRRKDQFPFTLLPDATVVIEMASTAGLDFCRGRGLTHRTADTFGVGLQIHAIAAALPAAKRIVVGLGGSATNDGGWGMARALGWREESGRLIAPELKLPEIVAACDVTNPLLGPNGCTRIFGPQKGVTPDDFEWHEARLARLASHFPAELAETPVLAPQEGGVRPAGVLQRPDRERILLFASLAWAWRRPSHRPTSSSPAKAVSMPRP